MQNFVLYSLKNIDIDLNIGREKLIMQAFIIGATIIIYLVLILWTWKSLGNIERPKKIICLAIGLIITYIITYIIFQISKGDLNYPSEEIMKTVQNVLLILFTGINGCVLMPYAAKILDRINEEEIDSKILKKKLIIFAILFVIIFAFEIGYMGSTQEGILQVYNSLDVRSGM